MIITNKQYKSIRNCFEYLVRFELTNYAFETFCIYLQDIFDVRIEEPFQFGREKTILIYNAMTLSPCTNNQKICTESYTEFLIKYYTSLNYQKKKKKKAQLHEKR